MSTALLLLAGGKGTRFGGSGDKVLLPVAGKPLLAHSLEAFLRTGLIDRVCIVVQNEAQRMRIEIEVLEALTALPPIAWALAGAERQDSVLSGLEALAPLSPKWVLIHDGARPCITPRAIEQLLERVRLHSSAVLGRRVQDTLKQLPATQTQGRLKNIDRSGLWAVETPQGFDYQLILEAYRAHRTPATDDTAMATLAGHSTTVVENPDPNPKLTTAADLPFITFLLTQK